MLSCLLKRCYANLSVVELFWEKEKPVPQHSQYIKKRKIDILYRYMLKIIKLPLYLWPEGSRRIVSVNELSFIKSG